MIPYPVSPIDENHLLYGNYIGLQYLFSDGLDTGILVRAVAQLIDDFPALAGRYDALSSQVMAGENVKLSTRQHDGSAKDWLDISKRPDFIEQPRRKHVLKARTNLSTYTLTTFKDGGCALGIAISHVLTDAAGYHKIMHHLAGIYTALSEDKAPPPAPFTHHLDVFKFGSNRSKPDIRRDLKQRGLPKPIPIKGWPGRFIKGAIIRAMDRSVHYNLPVAIHFTPQDVKRLKDAVLKESGEDWISTNMALSAHFTRLIAQLSYGEEPKYEMQIGQLLDLRNRYFETDSKAQKDYIGNAILIHIDKADFPEDLQNTSRGALARYYKTRQSKTDMRDVKTRLDLLADSLRHGYTNPELDVKNPIISLNNQSKMNVYDAGFAGQSPLRVVPQDVGDNVMFFPAADGGVEIHIRDIVNPLGQYALLRDDWHARIFDF